MIDWIRWTCIWHLKIWRETQAPPDYAGLLWLQWCLKLKAFQTKPVWLCVCVESKEVSLWVWFVFIYIQTPVCMAVKKNISSYVHIQQSFTHARICAWKKYRGKTHNIAFFVIALVLHTDTQRAPRQNISCQLLLPKVARESNHIYQSISITVDLSLVHITRLYWKRFKRARSESLQTLTEMGKWYSYWKWNRVSTDCHVHDVWDKWTHSTSGTVWKLLGVKKRVLFIFCNPWILLIFYLDSSLKKINKYWHKQKW